MLKKFGRVALVFMLAVSLFVTGCGTKEDASKEPKEQEKPAPKEITINGAGASFPNPLYTKMIAEYRKLKPEVTVNYQSIGSGGGIRQLTEGTVNFAGTDAFMSNDAVAGIANGVIHVPMTIGPVAIVYNVEGVPSGLKLTAETLTDIYLGKIKKWNDPKLVADNPDLKLPNMDITPVFRSDGSGTTAIFTDYLTVVSSEWKDKVGMGSSVSFPAGIGGKGNEGVTGSVQQLPGSIGYVNYSYAVLNNLAVAHLQNKEGNFTPPSLEATSAAAAGAIAVMPKDTRVSIVNPPGKDAYAISGFSWILVYEKYDDPAVRDAVLEFVKWGYRDGQKYSADLFYAPIPEELAKLNDENLAKVK